jgi:hypothetical protein
MTVVSGLEPVGGVAAQAVEQPRQAHGQQRGHGAGGEQGDGGRHGHARSPSMRSRVWLAPLGVDIAQPRHDHTHPLPHAPQWSSSPTDASNTTNTIEDGMERLATIATAHAALPLRDFVQARITHFVQARITHDEAASTWAG